MEKIEKTEKSWTVITVMNDVKEQLDEERMKKEKELNITLSWSKFLQLFVNEVGDLRKELARLSRRSPVQPGWRPQSCHGRAGRRTPATSGSPQPGRR